MKKCKKYRIYMLAMHFIFWVCAQFKVLVYGTEWCCVNFVLNTFEHTIFIMHELKMKIHLSINDIFAVAVAGRLYKHHSKHTSNSGFDRSFMPCSGYILFAAEQRVGYQISWVDLQREVNCPWNL